MGKKDPLPGKLGATLGLLVFAIAFSWFGLANGTPALVKLVGQWFQARSYVPVPAYVQSTELKRFKGEATTQRVQASFAYRYKSLPYVSNKVSASALADNFDSYHRTTHARLRQAKEAGEPVTIWVDPAHPQHALYERAFRWKPALFLLPFAVLFPAIGLGAWWGIWWVWFGKRDAGHTLKPGQLRGQSSPARLAPLAVTLVALFWNLVSWPVATLFVAQAGEVLSYWMYLVLLFPLIGLGLVYVAVIMWRARWRVGMPMLELMQAPAGGQFPLHGRVHFVPGLGVRLNAAQLMHQVRIVVKMRQTVGSGDDTTESTLWENCVLDTSLARGAKRRLQYRAAGAIAVAACRLAAGIALAGGRDLFQLARSRAADQRLARVQASLTPHLCIPVAMTLLPGCCEPILLPSKQDWRNK